MQSQFYQLLQRGRKPIIIAVLVLIVGLGLRLLSQYGFIVIDVQNKTGQSADLTILNQTNNTEVIIKDAGLSTRRFVKKSNYEVRVGKDGNNGWAAITSAGWLQSQSASLSLMPEKSREFVADSPRGCMFFDQQLLSYTCGQPSAGMYRHNQSSGDNPPGVTELFAETDLQPIAVAGTPSGAVVLIKSSPEIEEIGSGSFSFAKLKAGSFDIDGEQIFLDELDASKNYQIASYNGGIVVYDDTYTDVLFYQTPESVAVKINLPKIEGSLSASSLKASGTSLVISYQSTSSKQDDSLSKQPQDTRGATVVVSKTNVVGTYYHDTAWKNTMLCGNNTLCAMEPAGDKQQLAVLTIDGQKLRLDYTISNVSDVVSLTSRVLVVTRWGVIELNTETKTAQIDYTFNNYSYCGLGESSNANQYVLCVADKSGGHTLLIDTSANFSDHIDISTTSLRAAKDINSVIVDRKNIYIVLEYGDGVTRTGETEFIDDDSRINAARQGTEALINNLKLRSLGYNIEILL